MTKLQSVWEEVTNAAWKVRHAPRRVTNWVRLRWRYPDMYGLKVPRETGYYAMLITLCVLIVTVVVICTN